MSQIIKPATAGNLPSQVPEQFNTDVNSPAIAAAHILNEVGGSTTTLNNNGIQTDGSSSSNTLTIQLTNRLVSTLTTNNNTTTAMSPTLPLGTTPGVWTISGTISAYDVTDNVCAAYQYFLVVRSQTVGGAVFIGGQIQNQVEEGPMIPTTAQLDVTTIPNTFSIQVTGLAGSPGPTIHWKNTSTFDFVS